MRTIEVELFTISELDAEVRSKVIEDLRTRGIYDPHSEEITEEFAEHLESYGLPTNEIEWRLSWCQGDGVAFYGSIDIPVLLKKIGRWFEFETLVESYGLTATIERNSYGNHYSHWNTMEVFIERDRDYILNAHRLKARSLWDLLKEMVVAHSRRLETSGYKKIEAAHDEEYIIECAEANELEFTKEGRLWPNR